MIVSRAHRTHSVDLKNAQLSRWLTALLQKEVLCLELNEDGTFPRNGQKSPIGLTEDGFHYCLNRFVVGDYTRFEKKSRNYSSSITF